MTKSNESTEASDGGSGLPAADGASDAPRIPDGASRGAPPLLPNQGGPVLAEPDLVTVTFADDPNVGLAESFGDWIVGSNWLRAAEEYGVGTGVHRAKVRLPTSAPATATPEDIESLLVAGLRNETLPTLGPSRIFAVYFPRTTALLAPGLTHCRNFTAYHSEASLDGVPFAYAAIGDCPTYVAGLDERGNIERSASHEIIEGATDPRTRSAPAIVATDPHNPWTYLAGEVADICPLDGVITEAGFIAQRFWSNAAAQRGFDPCVPAPARTYFNVAVSPSAAQVVSAGRSVTVALDGVATGPMPDWSLEATSVLGAFDARPKLARATMGVGARTTMTLTVPAGAKSGDYAFVQVRSRSGGVSNTTPVAVLAR